MDGAEILDAAERDRIERLLSDYERRTGHQLVLHSAPSLQGYPIEEYAIRVAEAWRIGRKGLDDGVILTIAPNEREVMILVGYGLEGAIPDAIAARIVREYILPLFRQGDLAAGALAGLEQIMAVAAGEPLGTAYLEALAGPAAAPTPAEEAATPEPASATAPEERPFRVEPIPWGDVSRRVVGRRDDGRVGPLFTLLWLLVILAVFLWRPRFFLPFLGLPTRRGGFPFPGGLPGGGGGGLGGGGFRGGGGGFGGGGALGRW